MLFFIQVNISKNQVLFSGVGSKENTILHEIITLNNSYSKFSKSFDEILKQKPNVFKEQIEFKINNLKEKLNTKNLNKKFVTSELQKLDIFYKIAYANYADLHGVDFSHLDELDNLFLNEKGISDDEIDRKADSIDNEVYKNRLPKNLFFESLTTKAYESVTLNNDLFSTATNSNDNTLLLSEHNI